MTAPRPVADVTITFTKQKRKNGWFLIETWSSHKGALEYGPMPEEHLDPLIAEIKGRTGDIVRDQDAKFKEHLRHGMAQPSAARGAPFNPQQESEWLRQRRNQKRK